jgi:RNA recognition motif-containing protein
MKILVRNLARTTTENEVRELFSAHGTVTECNLVLDQATGKSKGFAFVEMSEQSEAEAAVNALNSFLLANRKIRVKVANPE